ncbi:aromatic acid exporter family protein [Streptomyces sp. TRM76323]|uniref:Aromatic acid exporter family protein n=1 Tax=Streptomyces tamarix TaxID=3078565 RepID=A0ABU3QQ88_9ACTN|nr:aromatic acid exporter family protein [Streptomyces tamarix]MDT9684658.1 aromatic acid exporter family protein [Streptomyces tamarix]
MAKSWHHLPEALRAETRSVSRAVRRARAGPGRERDLVAQALKAALAALVAWVVASRVLHAPMAFIAPWVAVALVRATVYQSLARSLEQLAAIALGTTLATAAGMALDDPTVAMVLVLPVTLLVGNWRKLGDQGIYGATAALFTLTAGDPGVGQAVARLLESLLGAAVGVAVNMLVRPPVYLRDGRASLRTALDAAAECLARVARGLAGPWDHGDARAWDQQARRVGELADEAQDALARTEESARLNPVARRRTRLLRRQGPYAHTTYVLEELVRSTRDLTRTLREAADGGSGRPRPEEDVAMHYARLLGRLATAVTAFGHVVTEDSGAARSRLRRAVEDAGAAHEELRRLLAGRGAADPEWMGLHGSLLVDAHRAVRQLLQEPPHHDDRP